MSISNYLNKLCNTKNDLVNILKPFNSSINSNSKYDELVNITNNEIYSHYVTYNDGTNTIIFDSNEIDSEEFNYPVTIGNKVTDCRYMFYCCYDFNQPVVIPDKVTDCGSMFAYCDSFNYPVVIPDSVTNCSSMFDDCDSFNQPVTIGNRVTDCGSMFGSCSSFNQPITIPDSAYSCSYMFEACYDFNQPVTIGSSVVICGGVFDGCHKFGSNVYIKSRRISVCVNMFAYKNTNLRVNIHIPNTNSTMINLFTNTSASASITGRAITYTHTDPNLYYNTAQNIYIYTNYTW